MPSRRGYDPQKSERALADINPVSTLGYPTGNRFIQQRSPDERAEFELFRPIRNIPRQQREIAQVCYNAYERVDILRNVIDMMSSFGCQGIQVVHPVRSRERVYKAWWNRVNGSERSERFLNGLYAGGNVVVHKTIGKLTTADLRDLRRSSGGTTPDAEYERLARVGRNEIPIEYTFLNPWLIETAGGDLATFLGHPTYIFRIPNFIVTMIRAPKTPDQKQMVADLPAYIRDAVNAGQKFVKLDPDRLAVYHYMKPDWRQWAMPMTYSILSDVILYEQMKAADYAALQGIISHIYLWKLGSLEHEIQVGPAMYQRLQDILTSIQAGGPVHVLWDAAIELQESSTDMASILGEAKYRPVLQAINSGLGIPSSLSGGDSKGAGFTNNAISLKTLIERLQYGRTMLNHFWSDELRVLQEAFGDAKPARILYDNMSLYDEAAEKMLWFNLYDRHLVDDETLQEKFGLDPEVVAMRIRREETQRNAGKKPPKATPFHDPQSDHELTKIALQQGTVSPSQVGVETGPKKDGDRSTLDFQEQQANKDRNLQKKQMDQQAEQQQRVHEQQLRQQDDEHKQKLKQKDDEHKATLPIKVDTLKKRSLVQLQNQKKGVPGQGRPRNKKDSKKRKQKRVTPSPKAVLSARRTLDHVTREVKRQYLEDIGKSTARSLTTGERDVLAALVYERFMPATGHAIYQDLCEEHDGPMTAAVRRDLMAEAHAIAKSGEGV